MHTHRCGCWRSPGRGRRRGPGSRPAPWYTACANNGAITGRTKIGGLGAEVKSTKVVDSCNTGAIGLIAYGTGKQAIGGLFAEIRYGSSITRSYNSGAVTGDCYVGGLVGSVGSSSDATNGPSYIVNKPDTWNNC